MNETIERKDPLRFRIYFWLMDAAFVAAVLGVLNKILFWSFDIRLFGLPSPIDEIVGTIGGVLANFLPPLLIVAWFMRDQYATVLWTRTAMVLTYFMATMPLALVLFMVAVAPPGTQESTNPLAAYLLERERPINLIWRFWGYSTMFFVLTFQFLRWRDSR